MKLYHHQMMQIIFYSCCKIITDIIMGVIIMVKLKRFVSTALAAIMTLSVSAEAAAMTTLSQTPEHPEAGLTTSSQFILPMLEDELPDTDFVLEGEDTPAQHSETDIARLDAATPSNPNPSLSDEEVLEMLFRNSYEVFDQYRYDNGVYRDSILLFDGTPYHPSSIAASGIGLMSLPIADKKGWDDEALEKAILTVKTMAGYTEGFTPDVSPNGFIRHFINLDTGEREWNSEYSTIDTAIFITGALFAKKYFNDPELSFYVDEIYQRIDFQDAIASAETGGIYMIIDSDGSGNENAITLPYNEYIIVAWLAYNQHKNEPDSLAVRMWNQWYASPENLLKKEYQGIPLLTDDDSHYLASFTLLFPYYMVNMFSKSPEYKQYLENAYRADQLWASNTGIMESYEWGNGAGNCRDSGGYHADSIENNNERIVSPHIISGFLPLNPNGRNDLLNLYRNNKGVYQLPSGGKEILWRYSALNTGWESDSIQAIDYSTFLFGLAANDSEIGMEFFRKYNNFFETSSTDNKTSGVSTGKSSKTSDSRSFGTWKQDEIGWWYQNPDGTYPKSQWQNINGSWYWFGPAGYMAVGWKFITDKWYYFNENGAMAANTWIRYREKWYFLNADGAMATGWIQWKDEWYYLDPIAETIGEMKTDCWIHGGSEAYYVDSSGKWISGYGQ